jgi:nicotinate-nucleotide adenylyltransferase
MMPANVPPHRPQPVASPEQRLAILSAALQGQDRLILDDRELRREGPSYSVDTLIELREEIGNKRPVVLLIGADAWSGLPGWHRWQELFGLAHLGVLTRAGHLASESTELAAMAQGRRVSSASKLYEAASGSIIEIRVSALEVSATQIRAELFAGLDPRYLVSDCLLAHPRLLEPYR